MAHIFLGTQFFFYSFVFEMKIYEIHYSASNHIQKLRLAADTPQFLEITELSGTHHLRSSIFFSFVFRMKMYEIHQLASKHKKKLRLAADTPLNLQRLQNFLAHIILWAQFIFYSFVFGMKIYEIHYLASNHIQKLRLAADTPQFLEITELSGAHHLRSSIFFFHLFLG
jgi:hypothetical protein